MIEFSRWGDGALWIRATTRDALESSTVSGGTPQARADETPPRLPLEVSVYGVPQPAGAKP